jgi:hypothetical protein
VAEDGGEGPGAGDFVGYGGAETGAFYVVGGGRRCHCGKSYNVLCHDEME